MKMYSRPRKGRLVAQDGVMKKYQGIYPAFYACYDEEGKVNVNAAKALAELLISKGVQGLYVGGSSGECIYQSVEERKAVLEAVMEAARGKVRVIAHVACNNTSDSMVLASHAEQCAVDAIASIPPIYFHLPPDSIAAYWNDISSAAPKTDFIIYNIPQLAGVALTMPLFRKMLENPRVRGVKNSSMPVQDIQMFKMYGGEDFTVFNGPDEQFVAGRLIGADGGIGGTYGVMPELLIAADEAVSEGRNNRARDIQYAVDAIIYRMCEAKGNLYSVLKEVIRKRDGLYLGSVRRPLQGCCKEDEVVIDDACRMIDEAIGKFL